MYAVLRDIAGRGLAIIFMFLVVALPIFQPFLLSTAYMGYADYAVSVCILLSLANLQSSATGGGWTSSMMAVVFAGMAALVKNEGLPLLGIVILAVLARFLLQARTEGRLTIPRAPAVLMLAGVIPVVVWQWWARAHGYHSDLTSNRQLATLLPQLPGRQRTIDHFLKAMPARSNDYGWLAVGFALSVILMTVNRLRYGLTLLAVVLVELAVYDFAFLFTPYDLSWHLSTAMDRVVLQMTPALLLLLAVSLAPYIMGNSPLSRAYRHDAG